MAPEVWCRKYNEKCDVWSFGITLYILLCGYPPFQAEDERQLENQVCNEQLKFPSKALA